MITNRTPMDCKRDVNGCQCDASATPKRKREHAYIDKERTHTINKRGQEHKKKEREGNKERKKRNNSQRQRSHTICDSIIATIIHSVTTNHYYPLISSTGTLRYSCARCECRCDANGIPIQGHPFALRLLQHRTYVLLLVFCWH
jgi:hypothetical protein